MKTHRVFASAGWMAVLLVACGQPASGGGAGEQAASGTTSGAASPERGAPTASDAETVRRAQPRALGPDERRVTVVVLPGDASVEVDGQPARRRDGLIELVGKVGEQHRVRAFKGTKSTGEKTVTIKESGASPALVDLHEPPPPGAAKAVAAKRTPIRFDNFDE
ncbi:hypothetical protein WMF26_33090 [Sorangium sp. So ce185]|uniref:hypothetical protein n=1 Tax=Sorangium sp. So ce185 TaxID=3133287 RepID=UPI003F6119A9